MTTVLVLVPTLGREHLAFQDLEGRSLVDRAVTAAVTAMEMTHLAATVTVVVDSDFAQSLPTLSCEADVLRVATGRDASAADQAASNESVRALTGAKDVVVVHDPLCPLVAPELIVSLLRRLALGGEPDRQAPSLVASRPVVDTLKRLDAGGLVQGTVDRDAVRAVLSPVVAPGRRLSGIPDLLAALSDPVRLVRALKAAGAVEMVGVPVSARRVDGRTALLSMRIMS